MSPHPQINDRIKARLAELGMSATEAASRAGIAPTTLTRPLNDPDHRFTLSTSTLTKLCDVLECSMTDLLSEGRILLGSDIRAARKAQGLGQKEIADQLGVTVQAVSQWERDENMPSGINLIKLKIILGTGPTDRFAPVRAAFRKAREDKGWTQAQLADELEVHWVTISKIERGVIAMSADWIDRLSKALGVEVDFSIDGEKEGARLSASELIPDQNKLCQFGKLSALRDDIETAFDMLTALDKAGDGIGGDVGHGISAVALAARSALDNARSMIRAMEGGQ